MIMKNNIQVKLSEKKKLLQVKKKNKSKQKSMTERLMIVIECQGACIKIVDDNLFRYMECCVNQIYVSMTYIFKFIYKYKFT